MRVSHILTISSGSYIYIIYSFMPYRNILALLFQLSQSGRPLSVHRIYLIQWRRILLPVRRIHRCGFPFILCTPFSSPKIWPYPRQLAWSFYPFDWYIYLCRIWYSCVWSFSSRWYRKHVCLLCHTHPLIENMDSVISDINKHQELLH